MYARAAGAAIMIVSLCLLTIACGGSNTDAGNSAGSDDSPALAEAYERIEKALDASYVELGKPPVDWDNLDRVQGHAFKSLTSDPANTIMNASWSVSVAPDHIAVYVSVDDAEKRGEWRPS